MQGVRASMSGGETCREHEPPWAEASVLGLVRPRSVTGRCLVHAGRGLPSF
jgi:hypothetical protein